MAAFLLMIRDATIADAEAICEIYNPYIENSVITFEEVPISPSEMEERIENVTRNYPWLIYVDDESEKVTGYAYATIFKPRSAFRFTVESSVYLSDEAKGKGIGSILYRELFDRLKTQEIHRVIAGISLPNPVSVALHEKFGFEKVGQFTEAGWKFDRWVDVGYWEMKM